MWTVWRLGRSSSRHPCLVFPPRSRHHEVNGLTSTSTCLAESSTATRHPLFVEAGRQGGRTSHSPQEEPFRLQLLTTDSAPSLMSSEMYDITEFDGHGKKDL